MRLQLSYDFGSAIMIFASYLSLFDRLRHSLALNVATLSSTFILARSCIVCERDLASLGPSTETRTLVSPWVMTADPSAEP